MAEKKKDKLTVPMWRALEDHKATTKNKTRRAPEIEVGRNRLMVRKGVLAEPIAGSFYITAMGWAALQKYLGNGKKPGTVVEQLVVSKDSAPAKTPKKKKGGDEKESGADRAARLGIGAIPETEHGQKFWEWRSKHGRGQIFADPEKLYLGCAEYFQIVHDNPIYGMEFKQMGGDVVPINTPHMRILTVGGLCLFLGVTRKSWYEWRENREDLSDIIAWAEEVIRAQSLEGAAAGLLKTQIVARLLELADNVNVHDERKNLTDEQIDAEAKQMAPQFIPLLEEMGYQVIPPDDGQQ